MQIEEPSVNWLVLYLNKYSSLSSMIFSLKATLDQSTVIPSNTFQISLPLNFSEVHSFNLDDHFSRKWAASALFKGNFYKDCLGLLGQFSLIEPPALIPLYWGIMTPNVGRLPPPAVVSGLTMLPHVSLLSTQSPPPIWPVNTLLIALLSCCLYIYLFINKILWIYIKYSWPHWVINYNLA